MLKIIVFAVSVFIAYKFISYLVKQWKTVDINERVDEKNELMEETIKASNKVDKKKIKAYEQAKEKLEEI